MLETTTTPAQLLGFTLGAERFGLPLDRVRGVFRAGGVSRVPGGPAFLVGLVNCQGKILPVFDAGAITGRRRPPDAPADHVVVVREEELIFGLSVDSICGIEEVSREEWGRQEVRVGDVVWRVVDVTGLVERIRAR